MRLAALTELFHAMLTLEHHLQLGLHALYKWKINENIVLLLFALDDIFDDSYFFKATIFPGFLKSRAL